MDRIEGPVIRAPCGHDYDVDCVVGLFRAATTDESLFPPACCRQPFNFQRLRQHMDRELASLFEKKAREFSTQNRVYCSRASCSAFLGPATNSATAMACNGCGTQTCGHCKKAAHSASQRCTNDADKEVLAMATREGWKRCPRCGLVVELIYGCNHMTCRCNHQFCYLCLARWKTCGCLNWDPIRLTEAANDPELLAEAIRNLNFEEPPRPIRAVDRRARLAEIENANLPHRREAVIPRPRDIEAPLQDVRTPARPPPYPRGYVPNEPMEASGSGQNRAPEPVPMLVAHPQLGWIISYGPAPYPPPLLDMFTVYPHGIAPGPPRVVCQQHWWTPSAPLVAGPIIRGCSSCGNWQGGLWVSAILSCVREHNKNSHHFLYADVCILPDLPVRDLQISVPCLRDRTGTAISS